MSMTRAEAIVWLTKMLDARTPYLGGDRRSALVRLYGQQHAALAFALRAITGDEAGKRLAADMLECREKLGAVAIVYAWTKPIYILLTEALAAYQSAVAAAETEPVT